MLYSLPLSSSPTPVPTRTVLDWCWTVAFIRPSSTVCQYIIDCAVLSVVCNVILHWIDLCVPMKKLEGSCSALLQLAADHFFGSINLTAEINADP